jgi:hypothetical protein
VGDTKVTVTGLGGTYGGNPVACAAALASITTMRQHDLASAGESLGDLDGELDLIDDRKTLRLLLARLTPASAPSWCCDFSADSPRPKSPNKSACPRCTSHECSAKPWH